MTGAATWIIGDFLAYGLENYKDKEWGKRVPDGLYEKYAAQTGLTVQTLTNAKYVCLKLPRSRRREKLTFAHAAEIVGRVPEGQFDYWIDRAITEDLSVKALREKLRESKAEVRPEPNDAGESTFLETARQFARDYLTAAPKWKPAYRVEVRKILAPVFDDLVG